MQNRPIRVIDIIRENKGKAAIAAGNAISTDSDNKVRIATIVGVEEGIEAAIEIGSRIVDETQPNRHYRHVDKATIYVISAREGARIGARIGVDVGRHTKKKLIKESAVLKRIDKVNMFGIINRKIIKKGEEIEEQQAIELARETAIEARNAAAREARNAAAREARNATYRTPIGGDKRSFTSKKKQKRNRTSKKY
jgi:hypothetical protein